MMGPDRDPEFYNKVLGMFQALGDANVQLVIDHPMVEIRKDGKTRARMPVALFYALDAKEILNIANTGETGGNPEIITRTIR